MFISTKLEHNHNQAGGSYQQNNINEDIIRFREENNTKVLHDKMQKSTEEESKTIKKSTVVPLNNCSKDTPLTAPKVED